jgi:NAD(P)-dependent dehydrogenase (short-subunit alcohol dehydrogenase family)
MRVLVTGAASGLGAALTAAFLARGDKVLATDLAASSSSDIGMAGAPNTASTPSDIGMAGAPNTASTPSDIGMAEPEWLRLDVRSDEDWAAALAWVEAQWGGLDVLVNNAGVAGGGRVDLCTMEEWAWLTEINLFGVVRGARTFAPLLKRQGSGRIVNVASLAGLVHPPGMGSYNAVKAAVVAFSETLAHELAPYGVSCSAVCPSYFRTNLVDSLRGTDTDVAAKVAAMVAQSPISADDIAAAVLAGIDAGEELIVPDEPARAAYDLKRNHRDAYDTEMRRTAARMKERAS